MNIASCPSPNFGARAAHAQIEWIVLHYTGMQNAAEALARLQDPASEVSAHYMVDEDGAITLLVKEEDRAWHAGRSFWRGERDVNSRSIGIELVNPGHAFGYRPFPPAQLEALAALLQEIMERRLLPASCLLAHSDVAPERKQDPGELFPWQAFAQRGFGLWPAPTSQDETAPAGDGEAQALLKTIGYDNSQPASLAAFQRRYRPLRIDGAADPQTLALLRAVARKS